MAYVDDLLIKRREEILATLETHEPDLVRELRDVDVAIAGISKESSTGPYGGMRQALDAITVYLAGEGHPDTQHNIVKALMNGGFAPLDKRRRFNVADSIRYHTGHSKKLVVFPPDADHSEERIGLPEWTVSAEPEEKDGK